MPIPSGYVSTVDLSLYSPKIAAYSNISLEIAFADLPNTVHDQAYFITANPSYSFITYDFAHVMYSTQFSNFSRYIVSYIPATVTQKASFHLMTKYNTLLAGAGNDRIVDEYLVQL